MYRTAFLLLGIFIGMAAVSALALGDMPEAVPLEDAPTPEGFLTASFRITLGLLGLYLFLFWRLRVRKRIKGLGEELEELLLGNVDLWRASGRFCFWAFIAASLGYAWLDWLHILYPLAVIGVLGGICPAVLVNMARLPRWISRQPKEESST